MSGAGVERTSVSPEDAFGPDSLESRRRIPLDIRERVWGGEGVMAGLGRPVRAPRGESDRLTLLASMRRLRASQRARGTVYGGRDDPAPLDAYRTRRISPFRRPESLQDLGG